MAFPTFQLDVLGDFDTWGSGSELWFGKRSNQTNLLVKSLAKGADLGAKVIAATLLLQADAESSQMFASHSFLVNLDADIGTPKVLMAMTFSSVYAVLVAAFPSIKDAAAECQGVVSRWRPDRADLLFDGKTLCIPVQARLHQGHCIFQALGAIYVNDRSGADKFVLRMPACAIASGPALAALVSDFGRKSHKGIHPVQILDGRATRPGHARLHQEHCIFKTLEAV